MLDFKERDFSCWTKRLLIFRVRQLRLRNAPFSEMVLSKDEVKIVLDDMAKHCWDQPENQDKLKQLWELVGHNKERYGRELASLFDTILAQHFGTPWLGKVFATLGFFSVNVINVVEMVNAEIISEKSGGRDPTTDPLVCDYPSGRSLALAQGKDFVPKGVQHKVSTPKQLRDDAKYWKKYYEQCLAGERRVPWWKLQEIEQEARDRWAHASNVSWEAGNPYYDPWEDKMHYPKGPIVGRAELIVERYKKLAEENGCCVLICLMYLM